MSKLYDIPPMVSWLRESGIPFRAKLSVQNKWVRSRQAVKFFSLFANISRTEAKHASIERDIMLDLHIRRSDYPLVRLRHQGDIKRYTKRRAK